MEQTIILSGRSLNFHIRRHHRARRIKLSTREGKWYLTLPPLVPAALGIMFIKSQADWVLKHLAAMPPVLPTYTSARLAEMKLATRALVKDRLAYYNRHYRYGFSRITIRHQKTRWGSCSSSGTLSFNAKLCLLPRELADYVVVHELCHLKELNHSPHFWKLVAQTIPDYRALRRRLRRLSVKI